MTDKAFKLLDLPVEIRARILEYFLAARNVRYDDETEDGEALVGYDFKPAIFRVNRQLHDEAVETFRHQNTFVVICTPWERAEKHTRMSGAVPIIMRGKQAKAFTHYRMIVEVEPPEFVADMGQKSVFVICLEDLTLFCKMWYYSDITHGGFNQYLKIYLKVQDLPAPSNPELTSRLSRTAQAQLIQPFYEIRNVSEIVITGPIEQSVKDEFVSHLKDPFPSREKLLDKCDALKDLGNIALKNKDYLAAKSYYEQAFQAIHIVVKGRRRQIWGDAFFDMRMREGKFKGQEGSIIRTRLRVQLVANMMQVHLKMNKPEEARFWGMRSIEMVRAWLGDRADQPQLGFPASDAWGKVYFRTGLACQLLELEDEARQMFRIAADWLPDYADVQTKRTETALRIF